MQTILRVGISSVRIDALRVVLAVLLVTLVAISRYFGSTWDEGFHQHYGTLVFNFFASGFTDLSALSYSNLYLYGGLHDVLCVVVEKIFVYWPVYAVRHAVNAAVGWIGLVYAARLAKLVAGSPASYITIALLLLSPTYLGHMMNNPKDIPFASMYVMAIFYIARYLKNGLRSTKDLTKIIVSIALAMNIRAGGIILLSYLLLWVGCYYLWQAWARRSVKPFMQCKFFFLVVGVPIITIPLATVFWPWAAYAPYARVFEALERMSHFKEAGDLMFEGQRVSSHSLPWSYAPLLLGVTTPLIVHVGILAGLARMLFKRPDPIVVCILFSAVFPVVYVIAVKAVLYDSIRHLLFIYPPLVVFASLGILEVVKKIQSLVYNGRSVVVPTIAVLAALILCAHPFIFHLRNFPNQTVYFNQLIGGVRGAVGRFELDYWGNCQFQALQWIMQQARQTRKRVTVSSNNAHIAAMAPINTSRWIKFTGTTWDADYFIHHYRFLFESDLDTKGVIHQVTADGVPLCIVKYGSKKQALQPPSPS